MAPPPLPTPPSLAGDAESGPSPRPRPRPRPSEQVRVARELWLLREQARVQAAERHFLAELQSVLHRALANIGELVPPQNAPLRRRGLRSSQQSVQQQRQPGFVEHGSAHMEQDIAASEDAGSSGQTFDTVLDSDSESQSHSPTESPRMTEVSMGERRSGRDNRSRNMLSLGPDIDPFGASDVVLLDGVTYENNPPPRDEHNAPVREQHGNTLAEVQQLRRQQHVTNLSPAFRAILEGNAPPRNDDPLLSRTRSWGDLRDQRPVSNTLDSSFRHELESVLVRRSSRHHARRYRDLYTNGPAHSGIDDMDEDETNEILTQMNSRDRMSDRDDFGLDSATFDLAGPGRERDVNGRQLGSSLVDATQSRGSSSARDLESAVRALSAEVNVLKNVIGASFDMQLDIQRAIRQEVSAAMNRHSSSRFSTPSEAAMPTVSACTDASRDMNDASREFPAEGSTANVSATAIEDTSCLSVPTESPGGEIAQTSTHGASSAAGRSRTSQLSIDRYILADRGVCVVCLEARVDSLLYSCGHMCSCAMCGRHLIASGLSCPVCRAPIRDVVRVYMVAEN